MPSSHSFSQCCPDGNSIITTFAGTGGPGYTGDGGPATNATFNEILDLLVAPTGDVYVADSLNHVVRKIDTSGTITTVFGTGSPGSSGDGGPASAAKLTYPCYLALDASGNFYITDRNSQRIRKVDAGGTITTFAGNGIAGFTGDGGPATLARIKNPFGVAVDNSGNVIIGDEGNQRLRMVDVSGIITTIAGTGVGGFSGDGGPATLAKLNGPQVVFVDPSGNIYFEDDFNNRVRKIDTNGIITTFAGTGTAGTSGDSGPASIAQVGDVHGIAFCGSRIYMADKSQGVLRMVDACGIISSISGIGGNDSGDGGALISATLGGPAGMAFDAAGNLYVTEQGGVKIRKIAPDCSPTPTLPCITNTPTNTPTSTGTSTPTASPTNTPTSSPTITCTNTPTNTATSTCVSRIWPDPYDPEHSVRGTLKVDCLPPGAEVSFFTVSGELIDKLPAIGSQLEWNGQNHYGYPVSSGLYFYVVQLGNKVLSRGKFLVQNH